MAITKTIIKMNHIEALVKVINEDAAEASTTISLNGDLLKSNEELTGEPIIVHLSAITSSLGNEVEVNIKRNNTIIASIFENDADHLMEYGADPTHPSSNVVVEFTGKGTVFIRLLKVRGYRPLFRPEQGVNLV